CSHAALPDHGPDAESLDDVGLAVLLADRRLRTGRDPTLGGVLLQDDRAAVGDHAALDDAQPSARVQVLADLSAAGRGGAAWQHHVGGLQSAYLFLGQRRLQSDRTLAGGAQFETNRGARPLARRVVVELAGRLVEPLDDIPPGVQHHAAATEGPAHVGDA